MKLLVATCALFLAACNPLTFSDLEDELWVDSTAKPDGLSSDGYGAGVVFAGTSGSGASIAVAAQTPAAMVLLDYDDSGSVERSSALIQDAALNGVNSLGERPALAVDEAAFTEVRGNVALGASTGTRSYAVLFSGSTFDFSTPINLAEGAAPRALAFGATDADATPADPANKDLIAVLGEQVILVQDYLVSVSDIFPCAYSGGLSATVVDVDGAGPDEVVVAGGGRLQVLSGSEIVSGTCATDGPAAPGGESDFGEAIVAGDFDDSGAIDLAVSAPSGQMVYVYLDGSFDSPIEVAGPGGSVGFGLALAAGDVDGDGADELIVGDPGYSAEISGGGAAHIYSFDADFVLAATLHDADPTAGQSFGQSLTVAAFNGEDDILVVGADSEVFTYFRQPLPGSTDVRN